MDLLKLFKQALKNPFTFKNLTIIFVNLFIITVLGLSLLSLLSMAGFKIDSRSACNVSKTKKLNSSVSDSREQTYQFSFKGNEKCFLNAWVTWNNSNGKVDFWLYDPNGNVNVFAPGPDQTHNHLYTSSPLLKGDWKLVLKTDSSSVVKYTGEISLK